MTVVPSANRDRSYSGEYMNLGQRAEAIALEFIKARPYVFGVVDLRNVRAFQDVDVDWLVHLRQGQNVLAEVKCDSHLGTSGNILFEIMRINHTAPAAVAFTLGWSARSAAKWFLFYGPAIHEIWMCDAGAYRNACQRYTQEARKSSRIDFVPTDAIKSTVNILIPETYFADVFKKHNVSDIEKKFAAESKDTGAVLYAVVEGDGA